MQLNWPTGLWHGAVPAMILMTPVTTVPSAKIAATADVVPQICSTLQSCSWTAVLSPPSLRAPHVMGRSTPWWGQHGTDLRVLCSPPLQDMVLRIFSTPFSRSWTAVLSPPRSGLPHATTVPSAKTAAKASCVLQICCTFLS